MKELVQNDIGRMRHAYRYIRTHLGKVDADEMRLKISYPGESVGSWGGEWVVGVGW